ncbi:hypothetical protein Amsp01_060640 [Amycolatopsis sp. NBRC 101858]|uniref:hypothetical protein n=1 Tax=Amycolatopsis sp. NBRC 101858 TaxID=3032200 RepID=UPI0024A12130|nr:hypothetical protein [Amycolatopsis sp. NBRC 101858]GLY40041.1 hypothetical protein Amsp01_060640 [Amycolatopsis sp. NBRC 101858]
MPKVLEFSVRTRASDSLDDVRKSIEGAFNIKFAEGEYEFAPAYVSNLLGMIVGLFQWGEDYLLETRIEDIRFLEAAEKRRLEPVRVSEPVANMLTIIGPYKWRIATPEDEAKDRAIGEELDRQQLDDEAPPTWGDRL